MPPSLIALAQASAGPDPERNLEVGLDLMGDAARREARIIVFPELSFSRFFPARSGNRDAFALAEPLTGPTCQRVAARAAELGLVTVINIFEKGEDGRFYDTSPGDAGTARASSACPSTSPSSGTRSSGSWIWGESRWRCSMPTGVFSA